MTEQQVLIQEDIRGAMSYQARLYVVYVALCIGETSVPQRYTGIVQKEAEVGE